MARTPVTVIVTGAAGNIGYVPLFRIVSGTLLGSDMPVRLSLLEISQAVKVVGGTVMEFSGLALLFPELVNVYGGINDAFDGMNATLFMDAYPRTRGMERVDLLGANDGVLGPQGKVINDRAVDNVRALVIGSPASINTVIVIHSTPGAPKSHFTATIRLNHNRAIPQLAAKTDVSVADTKKMVVQGNHSADQYPDVSYATTTGKPASELVGVEWLESLFVSTITKRGVATTEIHGASSAVSATSAAVDHVYNWVNGAPEGNWVTPGVYQDGSHYSVPKGFIFGMSVTTENGERVVADGSEVSDHVRAGIEYNIRAVQGELDAVRVLGLTKQPACGKQLVCDDLEAIVGLLLWEEAFLLVG